VSELEALKSRLQALSVQLFLEGDQLRVNAPKNALNATLLQAIKQHKSALMLELNGASATINPVPNQLPIPLSVGQQRLWSLLELQDESTIYNVPMVHRISGDIKVDRLQQSLQQLQRRQQVLQTQFTKQGDQEPPVAELNEAAAIKLTRVDLTQFSAARRAKKIERLLAAEIKQPFHLNRAPLWRATLIQTEADQWLLTFTFHHIIFDVFSKGVYLQELAALYNGEVLPPLTIQYADVAGWQRGPVAQRPMPLHMGD